MKTLGPIAAIAIALGVPAVTPAAAESHMTTGRTVASPNAAQNFVTKVVDGTEFEVQAARIAVDKARDPAVRSLAERMITDHTAASDDLKSTVQSEGKVKFPEDPRLTALMQRKINQLNKASGSDFDKKFINFMADDHKEDLALFRSYERSGQDPAIRDFVRRTLPTIENHMREVEKIKTPNKAG